MRWMVVVPLVVLVCACGGSARRPTPPSPTPRARPAEAGAVAAPRRPRSVVRRVRAGRVPPLLERRNVYAAGQPGRLAPQVRRDPARVYVPNSDSDTVDVISQRTGKVIAHFATGGLPQHVTPAWDLRTLWVTNDKGNSLTPIDPRTGHVGR